MTPSLPLPSIHRLLGVALAGAALLTNACSSSSCGAEGSSQPFSRAVAISTQELSVALGDGTIDLQECVEICGYTGHADSCTLTYDAEDYERASLEEGEEAAADGEGAAGASSGSVKYLEVTCDGSGYYSC